MFRASSASRESSCPKPVSFVKPIISRQRRELAPQIEDAFRAFSQEVFADGALSTKMKQIIAVAISHVTQCPVCIKGHTEAALHQGASPQELMEGIWVAAEMRAGAAFAHSSLAIERLVSPKLIAGGGHARRHLAQSGKERLMENRTKAPRVTPTSMEDDALNDALMATFPASDPLAMVTTLIPGSQDESSKTAPHDQASRHTNPRGGCEAAADPLDEPDLADSLPLVVFLTILLGVLLMLDAWPSYFVYAAVPANIVGVQPVPRL